MNFSSPAKVAATIEASDEVEQIRGRNRVEIDQLANGFPPLTEAEASGMNLKVNCNFGEFAQLLAQAKRQMRNAMFRPKEFFKIQIPLAPQERKLEWEMFATQFINRVMKKSKAYYHLKCNQITSVISHGIGPQIWYDKERWLPCYVPLSDLRIPTDTEIDFETLEWFAVRHLYTPGELVRRVFGQYSVSGWNKKAISTILSRYKEINYDTTTYTWDTAPEKMAELVKQNAGYYMSDAMPRISLWHFYFREEDTDTYEQCWYQRVLPEAGQVRGERPDVFLYTDEKPEACALDHLLHVQFGDLSNTAPRMYHSTRSLGFMLIEPCYWTNLMRCRLIQHMMENFNAWLRVTNPGGRDRASKINMFDKAIIPEGVSIVPQNERHQVNEGLINMTFTQNRQLQSEFASTYTQDIDRGTQREQTAFETAVKAGQANAMTSAIHDDYFFQETFADREICRRFCLSDSGDPDVKRFHEEAKKLGIPREFLNVERWEVEPETPIGSGNPTMEMAQIQMLMQARNLFDPTAQQEILHDFAAIATSDAKKAARLVPMETRKGATDAQRDAEFAFGTMMQGVPVRMKEGLNMIDQCETLLGLMAGVITKLAQNPTLATGNEVMGLSTVAQYVQQLIQVLDQNKAEHQRAKQYSDMLGKLMNEVKVLASQSQKQQPQAGPDPASQAKAGAAMMMAATKAKITEANAKQKMSHKDQAFVQEQARKNAQTVAEIGRANAKERVEAMGEGQ